MKRFDDFRKAAEKRNIFLAELSRRTDIGYKSEKLSDYKEHPTHKSQEWDNKQRHLNNDPEESSGLAVKLFHKDNPSKYIWTQIWIRLKKDSKHRDRMIEFNFPTGLNTKEEVLDYVNQYDIHFLSLLVRDLEDPTSVVAFYLDRYANLPPEAWRENKKYKTNANFNNMRLKTVRAVNQKVKFTNQNWSRLEKNIIKAINGNLPPNTNLEPTNKTKPGKLI